MVEDEFGRLWVGSNNGLVVSEKPLKEYTSYMAVLTNYITDINGNNATPDVAYNFGKTQTPWLDENGNSTYGFFNDEEAAVL